MWWYIIRGCAINLYANETWYIFFGRSSFNENSKKLSSQFWARTCYQIYVEQRLFYNHESHCRSLLWKRRLRFKLLPKLTNEHLKLTWYAVMNIRLAVHVLSSSVGNVLNEFGPPETAGTAKFCLMMDSFLTVWTLGIKKNKSLRESQI